jgi:inward rectifier potassium channel
VPPIPPGLPSSTRVLPQNGYTTFIVGDQRAVLRDAYHTFLRVPWPASLAFIAVGFLAINALFAVAYLTVGGIAGVRAGSFFDAFVFSVQTMGTIGYGVLHPTSAAANSVVIVESLVSIISTALITGLVFAKFSRATARIAFSAAAVITSHDGVPTLMFRLGNRRGNLIIEATLHVVAGMTRITTEGDLFYKLYDVALVRDRQVGMSRGWTVMHQIVPGSPLHGLTAEAMAAADFELSMSLTGIDDIAMETIHTIHTYTAAQIRHGHRFVDTLRELPNGDLIVDLRNFDATVPDDVPRVARA